MSQINIKELYNESVEQLANIVSDKKKEFHNLSADDLKGKMAIIGITRVIHGIVILKIKEEISTIDINNANSDTLQQLSVNKSFEHCIHHTIRDLEFKAFVPKCKMDSDIKTATERTDRTSDYTKPLQQLKNTSWESAQTNKPIGKNKAVIKQATDETDVLSIPSSTAKNDTNPLTDQHGGYANTTERYLDQLSTTEANRMAFLYDRQMGGKDYDENKPVLMNIWSSTCGHSNKFIKTWNNEFKTMSPNDIVEKAKKLGINLTPEQIEKIKELQVLSPDVNTDPEFEADVRKFKYSDGKPVAPGLPTIVLFNGKEKYIGQVGNTQLDNIIKFLAENI